MRGAALATAILLTLTGQAARAEDDKKPSNSPRSVSEAATYTPTSCFSIASPFSDVLSSNPQCPFVRELFNDGIAGACAAGRFCPENPVTRGQMAVFLERVMRGASSWDAWTDGPTSPSGDNWGSLTSGSPGPGTMMEYMQESGSNESSGIYFDGDSAILWSPGDNGLLRIFDEDFGTSGEIFRLSSGAGPTTTLSFLNRGQIGDQTIGFSRSGNQDEEYLRWKDTDRFELSESLDVSPSGSFDLTNLTAGSRIHIRGQEDLQIGLDRDNTSTGADLYIYRNATTRTGASTILQLAEEGGTLFIRGSLFQNFVFDLAESFLASEPLEAGDVVRVDGDRSNAVRRAAQRDGGAVLGVVSTKPGIVLGGTVMDRQSLGEWGTDVLRRFEASWPRLRADLLASSPELRARLSRVSSAASAGQAAGTESQDVEATLETKALQVFFERNFAPVALSGRVPVKVDASFGAVRVGDALTASAIPGVAMRATRPGPILGTALEPLAAGQGKILMFVNRGWWGGMAEPRESSERERPDATQAESSRPTPEDVSSGRVPLLNDPFTLRARGGGHAEVVPVSEAVEEGDVLVMDAGDAYRPSAFAEDATVVGVVATRPALLGGRGVDEHGAAVVVAGMTRVKVDATWGAIQRGDLLVSSPTRGHAMRADDPPAGTIVGKALESLESGAGMIRVLVMLR